MALTVSTESERRLERTQLLDVYRGALTERQREALRLHLEEDWSITELAQSLGTSRAAAYDLVRRGVARMEELEDQLAVCQRLTAAEQTRETLERRLRSAQRRLRAIGADADV